MNYFTRIKKSLLLVLISLFVQSCDKTCIKSNDFGEQSNVDLFKISAKDLSECVFDESSKDSSYSKMPAGGMLKKCMEGYKYDEDKNEYSTEPEDTVAVLIGYGYLDLGNSSDVFNTFKSKLEKDANKTLRETFEGYFCKDFDYLSDSNSNFIASFNNKSDVIANEDLIELNKRVYQECGNYCSNVCSGSLSTNNTSFDAATFSQLSWPHSTLKSSGSYYGINFKDTSNFKITATGSIQTSGIGTNIDANNSSIVINNNPYLPSYNLDSSSVWKATDKLNLFAKIEMLKTVSTDDNRDSFSKFYLDFVDFSNTKLQSKSVPIECNNKNVNMPNYVRKENGKNTYNGSLVFAEPKYSSIYCDYDNIKNICTFKADYAKLLTETGCLKDEKSVDNIDTFNNTTNVEPFNNLQKNYYKYTANDLDDVIESAKQFALYRGEEEKKQEFINSDNDKIALKYYEYTYKDNDGEFVLQYTIDEENVNYTGQPVFEFGKDLSMPFKVYIKSDKEGLSDSNKCTFTVNAKNNIDNFIKNKTSLTNVSVSDISYDNIVISKTDTWYPITQDEVPAVLNEYYSDTVTDSDFSVKIITSDKGCFDKLIIKIVPLREIEINKTGFLFFKNVLGDNVDNKIKFQVINPDLNTIVNKIYESKVNTVQPSIDDYKKEIKSNYFEYYQYNKTRAGADIVNDTFTTIEAIKTGDLKDIELLGKTLKENIKNYNSIFTKNAIFVRKGQIIRFDDSNWIDTSNLTIKTKSYNKPATTSNTVDTSSTNNASSSTDTSNVNNTDTKEENVISIANNIDLIYFIKERPALMCLTDKFTRTINIKNSCSDALKKNLYTIKENNLENSDQYLCNIDIKKEKVDETDNNKNCYVYIGDKTNSNESKFTNLKYLVVETTDDNKQKATEQKVSFRKETDTKTNYINIAEAFNTTLQYLYSITDFLENDDNEIKSTAVTVAEGYKNAIGELKTQFNECLGSDTDSDIFVTKNVEYARTTEDTNEDGNTEKTTIKDIGYMQLDSSSLGTYLEEIETALGNLNILNPDSLTGLKKAIQSNNNTINKANSEDLNKNDKVPFTVSFLETTNSNSEELTCEKMFPIKDTDSEDEKEQKKKQIEDCKKNKDKVDKNKEDNADKPILSFALTLFDNLKDDGCDLTSGLCKQKLTTCLDFSDYFGSVYNFDNIIMASNQSTKTDDKKFTYDITFASDANNLVTGFNIGGTRKLGGDLTTFITSNNYNEESDKENIITCSNDSSQDCYNKYKMTDIIVSNKIFPRLLDLNRKFLFPENSTTTNGEKTLSFKITSQDKKTNGENLAVFVGPADNLYDIDKNGKLCISNDGQDCEEENDNNIFWLIGYDSLLPVNNQLILKENNPFKFNVNGQLVRTSNNDSIIKVNDIVNDNMISDNGYNLAFFFKILDDDSNTENNSGFYTIKITELSDGAMDDIMQNWFERRQALSDSSINFKLEEPVSVVNLLFNSILGIMDGESYGVRSDEKKCDKTLTKLKEDEEICFIHDYSKNDSLNGKSCGTDGIDGYSESSEIAKEYCLQSCDQIGVNEVGVKCNIVYNNGGLLKLLYVNIIQNTLYQFIVKLALVLMLTLYGFGYFLGLSEFNQKEIMTRILRACFIYALISNTGWALYDKFVVSFFKQGIDSLLFLIASSFEVGENNYIEQAVLQNDYSIKLLLFSSTFTNIKMLFSEAVLYKILGLIFSGWLGILYAYLVLTGLITYIVGMFNAIALYLMAQMFMSVTLSIGPMIFLLMFFERTKGSFDNWLSILIGFALQEIFIIITVSFFNNLIGSIIKTVFAYPVCVLPILDINLLGVPLSILQFWKIPGTGFSGNILDLQNQAGPSFYSILLFYIVANLSNKFVTEMADLGNDIGDGIKATDIASGVTKAIGDVGDKMNGVIGGVASAPYTRASAGFNDFVKRKGDEAKQSMKDRFDTLNEARISPIKSDLEKQLKAGTYDKDDGLSEAYKKAHAKGATHEDKKAYREMLKNVARNQRLEKLVKNENLDQTARDYFKKKGIDIDEKNKDGSDKYTENEKRVLKEYFLGEKGYVNKDSMEGDRREVVDDLVRATKQVDVATNSGILKSNEEIKRAQDNYASAFAAFKGNDSKPKTEENVERPPVSANLQTENPGINTPPSPDNSGGQAQNPNKPSERQPQKPSENGGDVEQTVDRNIPQDMDEVNEDVMRFKEDTRGASED